MRKHLTKYLTKRTATEKILFFKFFDDLNKQAWLQIVRKKKTIYNI